MTSRLVRSLSRLSVSMLLAACAAGRPSAGPTPSAPASAWIFALAQAGQDVQSGRHVAADRVLVDFQHAHPAAPEALEATYYRALYKLDPANASPAPHDASLLLDTLLASPIVARHYPDAIVLRRLAATLEARATPPAAAVLKEQAPVRAEDARGRDEEVARLREELAKANAELERIKRRVATPKR